MIRLLPLLLLLAGCSVERWRYGETVPFGADGERSRETLVRRAGETCPVATPASPRFVSDGCSLWPEGDVGGCCVAHDLSYWCGGSAEARRRADRELARCVREAGHSIQAVLMHLGVRLGGHPAWGLPWRWGYGRRWRAGHWPEPREPLRLEPEAAPEP